jgi:signal transduction histidine kinase/ActR/RegA family two-component response regulator/HPt (histidine-containing phosphotransfer) domain-containing protein
MPNRILVVEDSKTEAMRARLILERAGYQVSVATDGQEGLQKASAEKPDVILLNSILSKMNGFETCGKLKLDPTTMQIPILMLVSNGDASDLPSGPGLECLLTKPYDPGVLVDKVKTIAGQASSNGADAQAELRQARAALEAARLSRMDFLANMSHELRTPLHEIIGMTELLQNTTLDSDQTQYLNTAHASSNALLALIGDVIEFSELEAGQLGLEDKPFELNESIERALEIIRPRATDKGIELSLVRQGNVPNHLIGDTNRLRQVLGHFLTNAVKFTEHGNVTINVATEAQGAQDVELHFCVTDTGIGIPKDRCEVIFEPFQQADTAATRRFGGLGMGLALAKQLVKLMGGRIWVESELGKGSQFHFTIKEKVQAAAAPSPVASTATPSVVWALRILVAEDSPTNQLIAKLSLTKAGHAVTVANNGVEAVKAFQASREPGGQPFDVVLMDVAMPEMDGLDATRTIREKEKSLGGHIPIVAMTAFATKEYQIKCTEAGMDAYVTKPVRIDELYKVIEPLLTSPPPRVEEAPVNLRDALEVVGDDVDILREAVAASLAEVPDQLQALKDAMTKQDAKGVEAKAHRLKGVMANLGGMRVRQVGQELETMGEQGNLANGADAVTSFEKEIGRVIAYYANPTWEHEACQVIGG